jgi:hypothetical protein
MESGSGGGFTICFYWVARNSRHKTKPVRIELVEMPSRWSQGFDRLSPNGMGFVIGSFAFPIILSLSKDKLSPNGVGGGPFGAGCVARVENINDRGSQRFSVARINARN